MHRYFEHCLQFGLHVRGFLTNVIDASALRPPHTIDWRCVQDQPGCNVNTHDDHLELGRDYLVCTASCVRRAEVDGPGGLEQPGIV